MTFETQINQLVSQAYSEKEGGNIAEAERIFMQVADLAPEWSLPWYELGLICKYQGRWSESLTYNEKSATLEPTDQASWWNLGIAATATGGWTTARRAWRECGIELPPGDAAPEVDFGLVPLRIDPHNLGEVVWGNRIDPARARLSNIPFPWSGFGWKDVVLHDGAPAGHRMLHGREVPVFNILEKLSSGGFETFVVELAGSSTAVEKLQELAAEAGGAAEDWGTTTRALCRDCSYGLPHTHDTDDAAPAYPHCGIAARDRAHATAIIGRWTSETPSSDLIRWGTVSELEDTSST